MKQSNNHNIEEVKDVVHRQELTLQYTMVTQNNYSKS